MNDTRDINNKGIIMHKSPYKYTIVSGTTTLNEKKFSKALYIHKYSKCSSTTTVIEQLQ